MHGLQDAELTERHAVRVIATKKPGSPCRVSLEDADLAEGPELETALARMFQDSAVSYLYIHYAKPECFAALVVRA